MKFSRLTVLGSTGSIGTQTLDVLRQLGGRIKLSGLSARGSDVDLMAAQIREFTPDWVHLGDPERKEALLARLPDGFRGRLVLGDEGLQAIAREAPADLVMVATVGWKGLDPALQAMQEGRHIALANKEVLVCGGHLVTEAARRYGVKLLPVDSEHNAIFQCLMAGPHAELRRLILTCSGGPFRACSAETIDNARPEATLNHPTWNMGSKVTVDSATLMNKGFEVIEAHHLFGVDYGRIEVVIHPQSTIHSMVEFVDGSIIAQLGRTDMRLPIQNVLTWPERHVAPGDPLRFEDLRTLTFEAPDHGRFPCLGMAFAAGHSGGSAPCVLNAANEVAVEWHLSGRIRCGVIADVIRQVMNAHEPDENPGLERLREWDAWGRSRAREAAEALIAGVG